jgi:hypothetical protein
VQQRLVRARALRGVRSQQVRQEVQEALVACGSSTCARSGANSWPASSEGRPDHSGARSSRPGCCSQQLGRGGSASRPPLLGGLAGLATSGPLGLAWPASVQGPAQQGASTGHHHMAPCA